MKGVGIDTRRITTPTYTVAAESDHIVPWRGAFQMRDRVNGPVRLVLGESGHIAGIINHPATKKRGYWINQEMDAADRDGQLDPDAWFEGATYHEGSWWIDWVSWLKEQSGELVPPPPMGNDQFPATMDAPGSYVLER